MNKKVSRFPHKLLFFGLILIISGSLFLFITLDLISLKALWPVPSMIFGFFLLYIVYFKNKSDRLIFPGMILLLGGLFFLLLNTVIPGKSLERIWPVFMDITAVSLIPYAIRRKRKTRIGIIISAISIIFLSLIFWPFSLIKDLDFQDFTLKWWPFLLIMIGIVLIIYYLFFKRPSNK